MQLDDAKMQKIAEIVKAHNAQKSEVIRILEEVQDLLGYIPPQAQQAIAQEMGVDPESIRDKVEFYSHFSSQPHGRYHIEVCLGTACKERGAARVYKAFEDTLGIHMGQRTEDGLFSLSMHRCKVKCHGAPVVVINGKRFEQVTPACVENILRQCRQQAQQEKTSENRNA